MRLIINADDFGKDALTNRLICEAMSLGHITETTAMVNMPEAAQAAEAAAQAQFCERVGLHLNLSEGEPLTENIRNDAFFCDTYAGAFRQGGLFTTASKFTVDAARRRLIREELSAQFTRHAALGFRLKHIDGHHHVHKILPVLNIVLSLGRDCGYTTIRPALNTQPGRLAGAYNKCANRRMDGAGLLRADRFFVDLASFIHARDGLPGDCCAEAAVHLFCNDAGGICDHEAPLAALIAQLRDAALTDYAALAACEGRRA